MEVVTAVVKMVGVSVEEGDTGKIESVMFISRSSSKKKNKPCGFFVSFPHQTFPSPPS